MIVQAMSRALMVGGGRMYNRISSSDWSHSYTVLPLYSNFCLPRAIASIFLAARSAFSFSSARCWACAAGERPLDDHRLRLLSADDVAHLANRSLSLNEVASVIDQISKVGRVTILSLTFTYNMCSSFIFASCGCRYWFFGVCVRGCVCMSIL